MLPVLLRLPAVKYCNFAAADTRRPYILTLSGRDIGRRVFEQRNTSAGMGDNQDGTNASRALLLMKLKV